MQNLKLLSAWLPLLAGLLLLLLAARTGNAAFAVAAIPGALLTAGGTRSLLFTDLRAPQLVAVGSVLTLLLALPLGLAGGKILGLTALLLAVCSFIAGGWFQIRAQPEIDQVPAPGPTPGYSLRVALDDALLGVMAALTPPSTPAALRDAIHESEAAFAFLSESGVIADPLSFHPKPPGITAPLVSPMRVRGYDCEHLRFESEFTPDEQLPGRDRWLGYAENRTAHALLLRHKRPGPWLICVHGFGMGDPKGDVRMFRAGQIHQRCGYNVALFTLPVHGPRSPGGFNGQQFFNTSVVDFVLAETQAIWDLRRLIGWIRSQDGTQLGVFGISLGGYTSALLTSIEEGLAFVIAGIPPTDMIAQREYLASTRERRAANIAGVDVQRDRKVYSVVSPLRLPSLVPHAGRFMFAASGDQFVPIEQVHALWLHWERPRISWCRGGHVSAPMLPGSRALVDEALANSLGSGSGSGSGSDT